MSLDRVFTRFANGTAKMAGKPLTFSVCLLVVIVWGASGPVFGFSDTWQLVINTGTTIVTFLMVFLIQNTQNRDAAAIHAKLDELIRVTAKAHNEYIGIEHLTDEELGAILEQAEREAHENRKEVRRTRHKPAAKGAKAAT